MSPEKKDDDPPTVQGRIDALQKKLDDANKSGRAAWLSTKTLKAEVDALLKEQGAAIPQAVKDYAKFLEAHPILDTEMREIHEELKRWTSDNQLVRDAWQAGRAKRKVERDRITAALASLPSADGLAHAWREEVRKYEEKRDLGAKGLDAKFKRLRDWHKRAEAAFGLKNRDVACAVLVLFDVENWNEPRFPDGEEGRRAEVAKYRKGILVPAFEGRIAAADSLFSEMAKVDIAEWEKKDAGERLARLQAESKPAFLRQAEDGEFGP